MGEVPAGMTPEIRKETSVAEDVGEAVDDDAKPDSDNNSEHKQAGVKQVEAITTVWSKELLIAMFILYTSPSLAKHVPKIITKRG